MRLGLNASSTGTRLLSLSTIADAKISNPPWVNFQSAGWVSFQSAPTRLNDKQWKPSNLKRALTDTPHDWAFCFDNMTPSDKFEVAVRQVIKAVERDAKHTSAPVLPIIHVKPNPKWLDNLPRSRSEKSRGGKEWG